MGMHVKGVDYISSLIEQARKNSDQIGNIKFFIDDCRSIKLEIADAVICLYDVIGTYVEDRDNIAILENIFNHLKNNGYALISVMNYELTKYNAKNTFIFSEDPNKLLNLPASRTMELSGNIFNPDYYLVDEENKVIYRREQFTMGNSLPAELIVRDRRYSKDEIEKMCCSVGFEIIWSRYVRSGQWDEELDPLDDHAKEILILCHKSISG